MTPKMTFAALSLTALGLAAMPFAALAQGHEGPMFPFETVDADKDGKVTQAELDAYRSAEATAMDANADGKLSVEELTAAQVQRLTARATDHATNMVERLDTDGDNMLSAAELAARPMPAMLFNRVDADGDGAVTEEEIEAMQAKAGDRKKGRHGKVGHGGPGHGGVWHLLGED